jgi:saccharopine dehydrogenase-like NADP-dependent oxidoreductase
VDLVVHAAGPFQQEHKCAVLEAAISTKVGIFMLNRVKLLVRSIESLKLPIDLFSPSLAQTAYIDVCDDTDYSWRAKGFHEQAKAAGVPAITTAGIYPGVSNGTHTPMIEHLGSELLVYFVCCQGRNRNRVPYFVSIFNYIEIYENLVQ